MLNEWTEVYTVGEEQTWQEIGANVGCDVETLQALNPYVRQLYRGCKLNTPQAKQGCGKGFFYTLRQDETLADVAKQFGIPLEQLLFSNPYLNANHYLPGQVLIIPSQYANPTQWKTTGTYEVGEKESIGDILRKFNMSIVEVKLLNPDLDVFNMKRGEVIKVEHKGSNMAEYEILPGENLESVAMKMGVSYVALLQANPQLRPSEFTPGQHVHLPRTLKNRSV